MRTLRNALAVVALVTTVCVGTWSSPAAAQPTLLINPLPAVQGSTITVTMTEVDGCGARATVASYLFLSGDDTGQTGAFGQLQASPNSQTGTIVVPQEMEPGTYTVGFFCVRTFGNDVYLTTPVEVTGDAPGLLRVVTSPALPAEILVDGQARNSWSIDWAKFPAGAHQVCFGDVPGYAAPACQSVDLVPDQTTTVTGTYAPYGYLRVITSPPTPSTISVGGIPRNDWGLWPAVPPGSYEVCFGPVADAVPPPCRTVDVTAGTTTTTTGTFTADPTALGPAEPFGYLRVTTSPAVGAQIIVDSIIRNTWGLDWLKAPVGDHQVCFGAMIGRVAPACSTVTVGQGETATVEGVYQPSAQLRVLTSPAVPATIYVDHIARNAFGVWTPMPLGAYSVCFGRVPGYTSPPCESVGMWTYGVTTTITGTYVPT